MKAIKAKGRGIPVGTYVKVADNSGAQIVYVFAIKGAKPRARQRAHAMVGDIVIGSVVKGKPDMRKKVVYGVVVRQKKEFRRPNGMRVKFEDNAIVILREIENFMPKGSIIKGPIAKEVADRFSTIAKIATMIL
ncbi:MAG: uL14 family ribosomal protein [Nanoarchaeota archaeon]|jgi:large subunit ribosomal protein L14